MSELTTKYTVEKQKARSADIVVHGTVDKPYYEIKYQTTDGEWHIGYSSRKLEMVFAWLNECFEIVSYEHEIRDKAIDEFVDKIEERFLGIHSDELHCVYTPKGIVDICKFIAEQMKEVENETYDI